MSSTKPVIFISYSHKDEPEKPSDGEVQWLSFVRTYLQPAVKNGIVALWVDRNMPGGTTWDAEIERNLQTCDIFILLVSAHSMASDYIIDREIATMMAAGPYNTANLDIKAHTVYTHKTPAGSVRAPSGPQIVWAVEQHIDEVGRRVGLDGYEIRSRNLLEEGDEGPTGQRMTAVGVKACLDKAVELSDYRGSRGDGEGVGLMIALLA